jgi:hypothetical protein
MADHLGVPDTQAGCAEMNPWRGAPDQRGPRRAEPILDVFLKRLHAACEQAAVTHERACQLAARLGLPHETAGETTPQPCGPGALGSLETVSRRLGELLSSVDRQVQELDRL